MTVTAERPARACVFVQATGLFEIGGGLWLSALPRTQQGVAANIEYQISWRVVRELADAAEAAVLDTRGWWAHEVAAAAAAVSAAVPMGLAVMGMPMDDAAASVSMPALEEAPSDDERAARVGDQGRGVCGLKGFTAPCHALPAPAKGWYSYCKRSHGRMAVAKELAARTKTMPALVDEQGCGVCGLEGCTKPCHTLPAPARGWYLYCSRSHGTLAVAKELAAASTGGTAGRTAKGTSATMSPRVPPSTLASEGPAQSPSASPLVVRPSLRRLSLRRERCSCSRRCA